MMATTLFPAGKMEAGEKGADLRHMRRQNGQDVRSEWVGRGGEEPKFLVGCLVEPFA